jgi:hypothetical protein
MTRLSVLLVAGFFPVALAAQGHEHNPDPLASWSWGAQAIPLLTHATPAERGRDLTEAYLTQPNLFASARWRALSGHLTVNFEGLTLGRGELNAGTWGEGYIDRRHPHTYLHEALLTVEGSYSGVRASLTGGRGFAPFGTDDPMTRPFVKYPANHHLAQVLERLVLIGAGQYGPATLEAGFISGDEPLSPESLGTIDRFADSWAARFTLRPINNLELQVSHAALESPEQPHGNSLDQRKWDVALRSDRDEGESGHYFLLEWARTDKVSDGNSVVALHSLLTEGAVRRGPWQAALRLERTERPEEERVDNIFRFNWPSNDERSWGMTRWVIATGNVSRAFNWNGLHFAPLLEVSRQWARPTVDLGLFTPEQLFGSERLWSFTLGLRMGAGAPHTRMGRYGVAH